MNTNKINYSFHYENFHQKTESHADDMANQLSKILKPHLPSDLSAQILDIGCGFGFALKAMQKFGFYNLNGLEISEEQGEVARSFGFEIFIVSDTIKYLNSIDSKFDFIILFDVLEHIEINNQIELLSSIYHVLKPGGRLVLTTPNANSIVASRYRYIDFTHYTSFTEYSLEFVLRNAGFNFIKIDSRKGVGKFPLSIFKRGYKHKIRIWLVRFFWRQVFLAELPWERHDKISFEVNLFAVAQK